MKVGDYVRTDTGIIEKLEGIHEQNETNETITKLNKMGGGRYAHILDINSEFTKEFDKTFSRGNIIKSSPNIIDLIEENDYVNGLRVEKNKYGDLYTSYTYMGGLVGTQEETYTTFLKDYENDYIQSIVTKEQFKSIEYEVE